MPYRIVKQGDGQFCVAKADSGEVLKGACHATREEAKNQLTAIMLSELRAKGRGPARMSATVAFALGEAVAEDDGFIYRAGKIFEAGSWEDKQFEMTAEELSAAAAAFERVPIDLEHVPTLLDQKLGHLEAVEAVGSDLYGVTALPKWLDDLLEDGERKVSATLDRATKTIAGLALVRNPRVTDAALLSAFSATQLATSQSGSKEKHRMNAWEWLKQTFSSVNVPEEVAAKMAGAPPATSPAAAPAAPAQPPATPPAALPSQSGGAEMSTDAAAFKKWQEAYYRERSARVQTEAESWAEEQIRAQVAVPVERAAMIEFYIAMADYDHAHGAKVPFGRTPEGTEGGQGSALEAFRRLFILRPKHSLFAELAPGDARVLLNQQSTDPRNKPMTPERKKELLGMSTVGLAILDGDRKGGA